MAEKQPGAHAEPAGEKRLPCRTLLAIESADLAKGAMDKYKGEDDNRCVDDGPEDAEIIVGHGKRRMGRKSFLVIEHLRQLTPDMHFGPGAPGSRQDP